MSQKEYLFSFERLQAWKQARHFVTDIYSITDFFPKREWYGLVNQLRRAAVSVAANLAEGSSRTSLKDQARFTQYSFSSLMEVLSHLYIAGDLDYINDGVLKEMKNQIHTLSNMINALRKSQLKRFNSSTFQPK